MGCCKGGGLKGPLPEYGVGAIGGGGPGWKLFGPLGGGGKYCGCGFRRRRSRMTINAARRTQKAAPIPMPALAGTPRVLDPPTVVDALLGREVASGCISDVKER